MSFAQGLANGLNMGIRLSQAKDAEDRDKRLQDRQDKQWAREDEQRAALDAANKAARDALQAHRDQYSASVPQPEQRLTFTGNQPQQPGLQLPPMAANSDPAAASVPAMPALSLNGQGAQGPGADMTLGLQSLPKTNDTVAVQRPAPKYDEREGVLAGLTARRKSLMNSGVDDKLWMDDWAKESQLRGQMRAERVDSAEKRFLATGDPGEYAKAVYPLIDDGFDFVGTKPVKTADGRTAWEFTRRDQQTGREVSNVMDSDQFQRFMLNVRDPKAVAEYEAKALLERIKANEKIRAEQAAEAERRDTERLKGKIKSGHIAAEGAQDRLTVGARGAQERATNAAKPITLGEGEILTVPGKDGKRVTAAEGKPRTLGSTATPSAANRILDERQRAQQAIVDGRDPELVKRRFRDATGEDF
ncbi:MAG: hypothetical protein IIA02_10870 [Proteobacteria bacterium]|nr:hypothetical protein [Pseudomonadota bacterium]